MLLRLSGTVVSVVDFDLWLPTLRNREGASASEAVGGSSEGIQMELNRKASDTSCTHNINICDRFSCDGAWARVH